MKNRDLLTQARDLLANSRRNRGADADALDEEWYRTDADFELDGLDEDDSLSERRGPSLAGRAGMGCLWWSIRHARRTALAPGLNRKRASTFFIVMTSVVPAARPRMST